MMMTNQHILNLNKVIETKKAKQNKQKLQNLKVQPKWKIGTMSLPADLKMAKIITDIKINQQRVSNPQERERERLKTKSQSPVRQYGEVYCFSSYIQVCDPFELTFMEDMR